MNELNRLREQVKLLEKKVDFLKNEVDNKINRELKLLNSIIKMIDDEYYYHRDKASNFTLNSDELFDE